MKEISVLVAVYNVEKYIEKCLESAFSNTYADKAEFIIVNDCTPDSSMEIAIKTAQKYPSLTVKFINHGKNRGLAAARNTGIENASCPYVCFLDSDDYVEKDWLETLYKGITQDPENDVFLANYYDVSEGVSKAAEPVFKEFRENPYQMILSDKVKSYLWRGIFKRSIVVENNIHWFEGLDFQEDFTFNMQYYRYVKKADFTDKTIYNYVSRKDSIIHKTDNRKFMTNLNKLIDFVNNYLSNHNILNEKNLYALFLRKLSYKVSFVINGTLSTQICYMLLWPESSKAIESINVNRISRFILTHPFKRNFIIFPLAFVNSIYLRLFTKKYSPHLKSFIQFFLG